MTCVCCLLFGESCALLVVVLRRALCAVMCAVRLCGLLVMCVVLLHGRSLLVVMCCMLLFVDVGGCLML